jgi:hypothetical protein
MKTDISTKLMRANHYPGSSCPAMGEGTRPHLPRQKPKRSAKGGRSGSGSQPNYRASADEG